MSKPEANAAPFSYEGLDRLIHHLDNKAAFYADQMIVMRLVRKQFITRRTVLQADLTAKITVT